MNTNLAKNTSIAYELVNFSQDKEQLKVVSNTGFVITPQKIIRCFRLSDTEKVLLIDLLSYMGATGYAFPSHGHLAFRLGKKSTASIKNTLSSLKEKGFIRWVTGGGDLGTNHYEINNLYYNPYIIMSEFTHYVIDQILDKYRSKISYDKLYSTVLDIVQKPQNSINSEEDVYGIFINYLFEYPNARDSYQTYYLYASILTYHIERAANMGININWFDHITDHFEKNFPHIKLNYETEEPIYQMVKNPYDDQPIVVKIVGRELNDEDYEQWREYRQQLKEEVYKLTEEEVLKTIAEVFRDETGEIDLSPLIVGTGYVSEYVEAMETGGDYLPILKKVLDDPYKFLFLLGVVGLVKLDQILKNKNSNE
jgi:hypothetical protein